MLHEFKKRNFKQRRKIWKPKLEKKEINLNEIIHLHYYQTFFFFFWHLNKIYHLFLAFQVQTFGPLMFLKVHLHFFALLRGKNKKRARSANPYNGQIIDLFSPRENACILNATINLHPLYNNKEEQQELNNLDKYKRGFLGIAPIVYSSPPPHPLAVPASLQNPVNMIGLANHQPTRCPQNSSYAFTHKHFFQITR